jgi:hypothetical protein
MFKLPTELKSRKRVLRFLSLTGHFEKQATYRLLVPSPFFPRRDCDFEKNPKNEREREKRERESKKRETSCRVCS